MNSDPFWFNDYKILIDKDRLTEFFPNQYMSHSEKLNAILRFSIYATFILMLYYKTGNLLVIPLFIGGLTLYIHKFNRLPEEEKLEGEHKKIMKELKGKCDVPTKENPFMNTLVHELNDGPKKSNCNVEDDDVKEDIEKHFNYNLYKDVNDIYNKNNSQRQFYTVPETDEYGVKHGDSVKFAKWLYVLPKPTCKENTGYCTSTNSGFHNDLRYQKHQLLFEEDQPSY